MHGVGGSRRLRTSMHTSRVGRAQCSDVMCVSVTGHHAGDRLRNERTHLSEFAVRTIPQAGALEITGKIGCIDSWRMQGMALCEKGSFSYKQDNEIYVVIDQLLTARVARLAWQGSTWWMAPTFNSIFLNT
ncbi:hypothetical protein ABBQ38_001271 [Trebouxia sp. C0009 RCD-2024]